MTDATPETLAMLQAALHDAVNRSAGLPLSEKRKRRIGKLSKPGWLKRPKRLLKLVLFLAPQRIRSLGLAARAVMLQALSVAKLV